MTYLIQVRRVVMKAVPMGFLSLPLLLCGCAARKAEVRSGTDSAIHYSMGSLYEARGEIDKAIREYETALRYDPASPDINAALLVLYYEQGKFERAIRFGESATKHGDASVRTLSILGEAYVRVGKPSMGAKVLEKAVTVDSLDKDLWTAIARSTTYSARMERPRRSI